MLEQSAQTAMGTADRKRHYQIDWDKAEFRYTLAEERCVNLELPLAKLSKGGRQGCREMGLLR